MAPDYGIRTSVLVNPQALEDNIVAAFKHYESGKWPVSMRETARYVIRMSIRIDDKGEMI